METENLVWLILNIILGLYAIILLIYGNYCRKKGTDSFVKILFLIIIYINYNAEYKYRNDSSLFSKKEKIEDISSNPNEKLI